MTENSWNLNTCKSEQSMINRLTHFQLKVVVERSTATARESERQRERDFEAIIGVVIDVEGRAFMADGKPPSNHFHVPLPSDV